LLLAAGQAQKYFPCRNIATEPNEEFRLDPEDYAAAQDLGEVIGTRTMLAFTLAPFHLCQVRIQAFSAQDLSCCTTCTADRLRSSSMVGPGTTEHA